MTHTPGRHRSQGTPTRASTTAGVARSVSKRRIRGGSVSVQKLTDLYQSFHVSSPRAKTENSGSAVGPVLSTRVRCLSQANITQFGTTSKPSQSDSLSQSNHEEQIVISEELQSVGVNFHGVPDPSGVFEIPDQGQPDQGAQQEVQHDRLQLCAFEQAEVPGARVEPGLEQSNHRNPLHPPTEAPGGREVHRSLFADGWNSIDQLSVTQCLLSESATLQEVPRNLAGVFAKSLSKVFQRIQEFSENEDSVNLERSLKWLLLFLPQGCLRQARRGGAAERQIIAKRFDNLIEDDWGQLVELFLLDREACQLLMPFF